MDIIKITMNGYGCEIHRGVLIEENYKKIEKYLDNVWVKNLFRELEKETEIVTELKARTNLNSKDGPNFMSHHHYIETNRQEPTQE